jgi:hypothetical protein
MSFLIDPPLLYATGRTYAHATREQRDSRRDALAAAATMAVFWAVSISLYQNRPWTKPIWWLCRAESGRDWMLNSGVLHLQHEQPRRTTDALSALIFASYPYWLRLGMRRREDQLP